MSDEFNLVQLSRLDGKAIMALTSVIGWDLGRTDWEAILAGGPLFGHKDNDGVLVSTAAIFPSGPTCAAIGAVMVHPSHQAKGLGRALIEKCLSPLSADGTVFLISTPEANKLYTKLGFETVDEIIRLDIQGADLRCMENLPAIRIRDLVDVVKLDSDAFGGQRYGMLKKRISQAVKTAVIEDDDAKTIGFALGLPRCDDILRIGPVIASDSKLALRLINFLGAGHDGIVRVEIPTCQKNLLAELNQLGFNDTMRMPVKSLGAKILPGNRAHYMAIDSQTFC